MQTPLHMAADAGNKEAVELLVANKAVVNARANSGEAPLRVAILHGRGDVAEWLGQHGGQE